MNSNVKSFIIRGVMFCWGGPFVLAIVWIILNAFNVASEISLLQASISIITITILAFIVAGITTIYQLENIPIATLALIQCGVIYITYLAVYLINGWLSISEILTFTIIFMICFAIIWLIIYLVTRNSVSKLNKKI